MATYVEGGGVLQPFTLFSLWASLIELLASFLMFVGFTYVCVTHFWIFIHSMPRHLGRCIFAFMYIGQ